MSHAFHINVIYNRTKWDEQQRGKGSLKHSKYKLFYQLMHRHHSLDKTENQLVAVHLVLHISGRHFQ